jgi:hypothetical protein
MRLSWLGDWSKAYVFQQLGSRKISPFSTRADFLGRKLLFLLCDLKTWQLQ